MVNMCPYCGKNDCIMNVVYRNVESYGANTFHIPCVYCGQMIDIEAIRTVKIRRITKSDYPRNASDF